MTESAGDALPRPQKSRWQPLRSGLLNLFRYDYEEFWYEDGHLLLRGYNGTGKSRVLALQLPFLLDGEVAPHRLEPDGDPAKRVEWNLLMGKYDDRLGYTWLELGRLTDEDDAIGPGHELYLTLGCGLHAIKGRGLAHRWFFITEQRVGVDLFLQGRSGEALTRLHLADALGDRGELFTTARDYRAAVDRRLFKLGLQRYEALVDLLIQLRQPQLSRKLDAAKLSAALSQALPPLDRSILADIAESFRSLELDRTALDALRAAADGADAFLRGYRRYAQIATRRRAESVRTSHSAYEHAQRRLRAAIEQRQVATAGLEQAAAELERLAIAEEETATEVRTLEQRPEMRDKQTLDAARRRAEDRRLEARRATDELERVGERRALRQRQADDEQRAAELRRSEAALEIERSATAAAGAGFADGHRKTLGGREVLVEEMSLPAEAAREDAVQEASRQEQAVQRLDDLALRKQRGVRHVRGLQQQVEDARQRLTAAKAQQTERAAELDEATDRQRSAHQAVITAHDDLLESYRHWRAELVELSPPSAADLAEQLADWGRDAQGSGPLSAAVRTAEHVAMRELEASRAHSQAALQVVEQQLNELIAERDALRAGVHSPPPPPPSRGEGVRLHRPGAALWQLCDFAPDVTEDHRAGLEAALDAAGLLDAWITPDGRLLAADDLDTDLDTVLVAGRSTPPPAGRGLDTVLRPDPSATTVTTSTGATSTVTSSTVTAILQHIGFGEGSGELWVQVDGRFQAGALHGRGHKPAAQHIGQSARDAERQRQLTRLEAAIEETRLQQAARVADIETLDQRQRQTRDEAANAPDEDGLRRAAADLAAAADFVSRARQRLVAAEEQVQLRRTAHQRLADERDEAARDLGIADRLDDLETLEDAVAEYRRTLAALRPTLRALRAAIVAATAAAERYQQVVDEEARRRQVLTEAETRRRASEVERDTLEQTLGAGVREILQRLDQAREQHSAIRQQQEGARGQREGWLAQQARADASMEAEQHNVERETEARQRAIAGLQRLIDAGLWPVALPKQELSDDDRSAERSVSRSVEICRALESQLAEVVADDGRWERQQREVHSRFQRLQETLAPHGYPPILTVEDDLFVVTAPFQGKQQTLDIFRASLGDEVGMRDRVLTERERQVIDNHLIGEVALHLHQRLRDAEELVQRINQQIERRPTSTGMTLRFRWHPIEDEHPGLASARRLLMSEHALWSTADRSSVSKFLEELIKKERQSDDAGTWQEHLNAALDYRSWHQFGVERRQDDRWRRLTRRTHGTGSGGEKAIALTVPQFAAAAAHYDTADKRAPRLILLDEAFVGIDKDMRAKCMSLLQAFDLDFVMTSEREWACYPTLPGVAIYQLATRPGIDAVAVSRWLWNGRERLRDTPTLPPSAAAPEPSDSAQSDLFAETD